MYVHVSYVCVVSRMRVLYVHASRQATCVRSMCLCIDMLHGPRGYARGAVRDKRTYVCACTWTALLDLGARMSAHHSCATSVCVCVCVYRRRRCAANPGEK